MLRTPSRGPARPSVDGRAAAAYRRLLEGVGERADSIGPDHVIASHWPFVGSNYRGLMIAGQSLERWDSPQTTATWRVDEARTAEGRDRILRGTQAWATREREPISEAMRHGNRRGTPFWGFSQRAAELLEPAVGGPWLSRYAWWNVYPLGWQERHGTPTGELHAAQTPFVADLFWAVAEELEVTRMLLISGKDWWWNVRELLGLQSLAAAEKPVIATGIVNGISIVATYHPGAHMAGVSRDAFAAAAAAAMRALT